MQVTNISDRPHRLYWAMWHRYLTWGPGESREVPENIGLLVCSAHPDKMVIAGDERQRLPQAVDHRPPSGIRRGQSSSRQPRD
jgi:hypothetical protein